jgi:hypothetical protein
MLAQFRELAASFYVDLLPSLVWLETLTDSSMDVRSLCAFLILDAQYGKEQWMAAAAYEAIPAVLQYFGDRLDVELVELALRLSIDKQGRPFIQMWRFAASILNEEASYDRVRKMLIAIVLDLNFVQSVVARVLQTDTSRAIAPHTPAIVVRILSEYTSQKLTSESAVALFSVLFSHSPSIIGMATERLLQMDFSHHEFVFRVLRIALPVAHSDVPLAALSRFCIENFKRGGMLLVGFLLLSYPELGFALLSRGVAKAAFLLCANDLPNVRAYLRFVKLALSAAEGFPVKVGFAMSVLRLSLAVVRIFGSDPQIGHQVISLCVQLIWKVKEQVGEEVFRSEFGNLAGMDSVVAMLRLQIGKSAIRQRNANLIAFSASARSRRAEDAWEDLAASDDD